MKNVLVCIVLYEEFDSECLSYILDKTKSDNYKLNIVIFNLIKDWSNKSSFEDSGFDIITVENSDAKKIDSLILELIKSRGIYCFTKIKCGGSTVKIEPLDNYIDKFNLELFEDANIGCIFSDNYISGVLCHKKSMPTQITDLDIFFVNASSFTECSSSDNPYGVIMNSMICRYIPIPTYKIDYYE